MNPVYPHMTGVAVYPALLFGYFSLFLVACYATLQATFWSVHPSVRPSVGWSVTKLFEGFDAHDFGLMTLFYQGQTNRETKKVTLQSTRSDTRPISSCLRIGRGSDADVWGLHCGRAGALTISFE